MKRLDPSIFSLAITLVAAFAACDLPDKSIGDEGGDDGGVVDDGNVDDGPGSDAGDAEGGDAASGGQACTLIGCEDMLSISLAHQGLGAGTWTVTIDAPVEGESESCSFQSDGSGGISDDTCNAIVLPGELIVQASQLWAQVNVSVRLDGIERGSASTEVAYEEVAPNGPGCGPVCTQGTLSIAVSDAPVIGCDDLEEAYTSAMAEAQSCTEAAECGQPIASATSCGCTRMPVARVDVDLASIDALWEQAVAAECPFTQEGGPCDCPEADGFACVDDTCTWNYL